MHRKPSPFLAFFLVSLVLSAPLSATPGATVTSPPSLLADWAQELSALLQDIVNTWVPWMQLGRDGFRERALSPDETPTPRVRDSLPNTGWVNKEGCSLDPLGRPIPPCPGGGGGGG